MQTKIVIIGAGPAGLLLAHYLLRRGQYNIDIYERLHEDSFKPTGKRTFPISLQQRGENALQKIPGLMEKITDEGVTCQGTVLHQQEGKPRQIKRDKPILGIERNRLVGILLEHLTQEYGEDQVRVHMGCECVGMDSTAKTVMLQPEAGEAFQVNYEVLIGADGAKSRLRDALQSQGHLHCEQSYIREAYKSLFLDRCNPEKGIELEPDQIHGLNMGNNRRVLCVPQPGNQLNGTIIFDADNNPLADCSTKEEILGFFKENAPVFGELMSEEEAEALLNRPVSRVTTVRCDAFHGGDNVLILGDAAHAVSPSLGQGCNAALEDVLILDQILDQYNDDWAQVLPEFTKQRLPDAHALRELSDYSFPRYSKLLRFEFLFRSIVSRWLHRLFPNLFHRFIFDLALQTDMPYSQILDYHQGWVNKVKREAAATAKS
jgi:kynurenine 3-monooxygenase